MANTNEDSFVEIGSSDFASYSAISGGGKISMTMLKSFFWANFIDGFRIDEDDTQSFRLDSVPVIFDSGTSLVYTPYSLGNVLAERALAGIYYEFYEGFNIFECSVDQSLLKDVEFYIDGRWHRIPPSTYVIEVDSGICVFGFLAQQSEFFLLGAVWERNYYTSYDDDNGIVDFAPRKGSGVTAIPVGTLPDAEFVAITEADVELILIIVGAVLALTGTVLGLLYNYGVIKGPASSQSKFLKDSKIEGTAASLNSSTISLEELKRDF